MAGGTVAFNKESYNALITFYDGGSDQVVHDLMHDKDTMTPRLEQGLYFRPGSSGWSYAADFNTRVTGLAGFFGTEYKTLHSKWGDFAVSLTSARDVFDDTDDLANYSAQEFLGYLPDVNAHGRPPK